VNALKLVLSLIALVSDVKLRRLLKSAITSLVEELRKQPTTCNGINQQALIDENNLLRKQVEEAAGRTARQRQLFQENEVFKKSLAAKDQQIAMLQQSYDDVSKAHASMMETELKLRNRITELTKIPKTDSQIRSWALEQIARACLVLHGRPADCDMSTDTYLLTGKLECSILDGRASDAACSAALPFSRMIVQHDDLYDMLYSRLGETERRRELRKLYDRRHQ
jgi:hypothetical protein